MAHAGAELALGAISADPLAPLVRATDTLADLRGLATKAGQMAGIWSAMLPPEERQRAEPILARLRSATSTSDPQAIRARVAAELGATVDACFASFEAEPFASASLGQVHGARLLADEAALHGFESVAVKVQHPGIEDALRADLDNAGQLGGIAALLAVPTAGAMVDEVRARLEEELDYGAEARAQRQFAGLFEGDPQIRIPKVVDRRSSRRVLTTERVLGLRVDEAARRPHAESQARAITRFLRTAWVEHGLLFADPHAGNWIFHDDGRVTVLDFGSVLRTDDSARAQLGEALAAIARHDAPTARRATAAWLGGTASDDTVTLMTLALAPLAPEAPLPRAEDLAAIARLGAESKRRMIGRRVALPAFLPLTMRALIGTMALLVELRDRS